MCNEGRTPNLVDDSTLNALDTHGLFIDAENACTFAGCRAYTSSELGEIVRHQKAVECVLPLTLEDKIIPLRYNIGDGTTSIRLAEGNTAVHAPSGLVG